MSQTRLADAIGLVFQQVHKLEKGDHRVAASRLWEIAHALKVPVSYFFEGLPSSFTPAGQNAVAAPLPTAPDDGSPPLATGETIRLVRAYYSIPDPATRQRLFELVTTLSGSVPSPGEAEMNPAGPSKAEA